MWNTNIGFWNTNVGETTAMSDQRLNLKDADATTTSMINFFKQRVAN